MGNLKSIDYYQQKINKDPSNSFNMNMLAFEYMNQYNHKKALFWFREAAKQTQDVMNLSNLGWYLLEGYSITEGKRNLKWRDRLKEAIEVLEQATQITEDYQEPYFALALAYYHSDKKVKAKKTIEKAISIKSNYFNQNFLAVMLLESGEIEVAADWFLKAYNTQPEGYKIYEAYFWYGVCMERLNNDIEAQKVAEKLLHLQNNEEIRNRIIGSKGCYKYHMQDEPEIAIICNFINCPICETHT